MSENIQKSNAKESRRDIRTLAYILRRTNYGEADRILNIITPEYGKISAIAKGVRKEKSKLAGGIEIFSLVELNVHFGRGEIGTVTGAKMLKYYGNILTELNRMEFASLVLKKISLASESSDNPEYFKIVDSCLDGLNRGVNIGLIESWFWLNYAKSLGEQINLYRDTSGEKLSPNLRYVWDSTEMALTARENGNVDADVIKVMRLMLTTDLKVIERIKDLDDKISTILQIARA